MLRVLPVQLYNWLEDIATENERDLGLIHPVLPNQVSWVSQPAFPPRYHEVADCLSAAELPERSRWTPPLWQSARNYRTGYPKLHGVSAVRFHFPVLLTLMLLVRMLEVITESASKTARNAPNLTMSMSQLN